MFLWFSYGFVWFSYGFRMALIDSLAGSSVFLWFSYGFVWFFLRFSYGLVLLEYWFTIGVSGLVLV